MKVQRQNPTGGARRSCFKFAAQEPDYGRDIALRCPHPSDSRRNDSASTSEGRGADGAARRPCQVQELVAAKRSADGSAVLLFITLLAIMMILFVANGRVLVQLRSNVKLLEHRQIHRLETSATNAPVVKVIPVPSGSSER